MRKERESRERYTKALQARKDAQEAYQKQTMHQWKERWVILF